MQKKKIILILLVAIIFIAVATLTILCKNSSSDAPSTVSINPEETKAASEDISENQIIIFDQENISLSLKSLDESNIIFTINNQTNQSISASCHSIAINKVMTQVFLVEDVNSGESKDVTVSLEEYANYCGVQKKEDIKNITLDFNCINQKEEVIISADATTVDLGDADYTYNPYSNTSKLHSENNIIVSATDFENNDENKAESNIIISNNSDTLINLEILSVLVNNSDIDSFAFSEIYPGCSFYLPIIVENISADSIDSFSLELSCSDSDYNEIFSTLIEK